VLGRGHCHTVKHLQRYRSKCPTHPDASVGGRQTLIESPTRRSSSSVLNFSWRRRFIVPLLTLHLPRRCLTFLSPSHAGHHDDAIHHLVPSIQPRTPQQQHSPNSGSCHRRHRLACRPVRVRALVSDPRLALHSQTASPPQYAPSPPGTPPISLLQRAQTLAPISHRRLSVAARSSRSCFPH
jgi:hypothetical protein